MIAGGRPRALVPDARRSGGDLLERHEDETSVVVAEQARRDGRAIGRQEPLEAGDAELWPRRHDDERPFERRGYGSTSTVMVCDSSGP